MEKILRRMLDEANGGIPVRTVKSFITKIPSVFTGIFPFVVVTIWYSLSLDVE